MESKKYGKKRGEVSGAEGVDKIMEWKRREKKKSKGEESKRE